jgi:ketosteroid isomerase-like protein
MPAIEPAQLVRQLLEGYAGGDRDAAAAALAEHLVAYVTNAEAGVDVVEGRDRYMARVPDLQAAEGSLRVTQVVEIDAQRALAMVEIRARRGGRNLHNFAAFLARVGDGQIAELWMVDALPEYSDEFWS